jgi:hypothetical protein
MKKEFKYLHYNESVVTLATNATSLICWQCTYSISSAIAAVINAEQKLILK